MARNIFQIFPILITDSESASPHLFANPRHAAESHHHHLHYSVPKHHNHNPRSLKLGYSRTIHYPSSSKKEIFERVIESHGKFNPRRPRASRSHCGRSSIDNELCPLDTWVSSTMKTAEVHVIRD